MYTKRFDSLVKSVDVEKREIRVVISASRVDREGDIVMANGAVLDNFLRNPVVLDSHDPRQPIGNARDLGIDADQITATVRFYLAEESPLAQQRWLLYSRGKMRGVSIGFRPLEWTNEKLVEGQTGRAYLKWELLEFSLVSIPSLPSALTINEDAFAFAAKMVAWRRKTAYADLAQLVTRADALLSRLASSAHLGRMDESDLPTGDGGWSRRL
jgi:HK97 family phage prohead protease